MDDWGIPEQSKYQKIKLLQQNMEEHDIKTCWLHLTYHLFLTSVLQQIAYMRELVDESLPQFTFHDPVETLHALP